jgi:hypothetical protein
MVADQQVLAKIESREYSLITSSLNTNPLLLGTITIRSLVRSPFSEIRRDT